MRSHYDFSKAMRNPYASKARSSRHAEEESAEDAGFAPLTRAQLRELDRRVKDADDRTRYIIAGVMSPRFVLYYDVTEDVYAMNEPGGATLFKRSQAARAVMKLLGGRCRVLKCRVDRKGKLVRSSLAVAPKRRRPGGG